MSKEYTIYHIPGKKIGVTNDLYNRVECQQGYEVGEYEVLESSEDIDYVSKRELELQKEYGYRITGNHEVEGEEYLIIGVTV